MTTFSNTSYYNVENENGIVHLQLNYCLFLEEKTYEYRDNLLNLLEEISKDDTIKVLILCNDHPDFSLEKYNAIWNTIVSDKEYESQILRAFRTFDQLVINLYGLKKVVISKLSKPLNSMLFNFNLISDVRVITNEFYVDNCNENMVNVPKGGVMFDQFRVANINPVKFLFLSDKVFHASLIQNNLVDKVFSTEELTERMIALAERLKLLSYSEIEAAKMAKSIDNLEEFENLLQKENKFLLKCIREKLHPGSQKIYRFH